MLYFTEFRELHHRTWVSYRRSGLLSRRLSVIWLDFVSLFLRESGQYLLPLIEKEETLTWSQEFQDVPRLPRLPPQFEGSFSDTTLTKYLPSLLAFKKYPPLDDHRHTSLWFLVFSPVCLKTHFQLNMNEMCQICWVGSRLISEPDICYLKATPTLALRLDGRRKPSQIRQTVTDVDTKMTKSGNPRLSDQVTYLTYEAGWIEGSRGSARQSRASGSPCWSVLMLNKLLFTSAAVCSDLCLCVWLNAQHGEALCRVVGLKVLDKCSQCTI